jgi:hypothetical protein
MGRRQYTPSLHATTLESNKSLLEITHVTVDEVQHLGPSFEVAL